MLIPQLHYLFLYSDKVRLEITRQNERLLSHCVTRYCYKSIPIIIFVFLQFC